MTCAEIIENYLKENGFDGLYCSGANCACKNGDLFPCMESPDECIPGYLHVNPNNGDWNIRPEKP